MLSGVLGNIQQTMLLSSVQQIGDVILVETDDVIEENFNPDLYSTLINSEVITETGDLLGRVRGFTFNPMDGSVKTIIIATLGIPQIPDQLISTYELSMDEVVSSGPDRLIVFEGAEEKLNQLSVGLLERVGIGKPPWQRNEDDYYVRPAAPQNQLPSGIRTPVEPMQVRTPVAQETWDDDNWNEPQPRQREPLRQAMPEPTYPPETGNWADEDEPDYANAIDADAYEVTDDREVLPIDKAVEDEDIKKDVWEDDENPKPYRAPQVNIPERKRVVEYEEETDY
jgi:sporulation protein YlmC with PRC-barrel domain